MRSLLLLVLAGVGMAIACDSPVAPYVPEAFVSIRERRPDLEPRTPFSASVESGTIFLDGHVLTPDPCHGFAAAAARESSELVVTLRARPSSAGCVQPLGDWNFRVTLPDVPSGPWRVRLRTQVGAGSEPVEVFDTVLTVR